MGEGAQAFVSPRKRVVDGGREKYYFGSMPKATIRATKVRAYAEAARLLAIRTSKEKTSVSISSSLLRATELVSDNAPRSAVFERALRKYLHSEIRALRDEHDLRIINANAKRINRESADLLEYQNWPD